MTTYDASRAPRSRESGYKGDGWIVSLTPDDPDPTLLLDTGLDSVAIVSLPDAAWDRAPSPRSVHVHDVYDETILVMRGSGTVHYGPDPHHITATRFERPVVIVVPAGTWHHVGMDVAVSAEGIGFFTVAGTVIAPFASQMEVVARAQVAFAVLPTLRPEPVTGRPRIEAPAKPGGAARLVDELPQGTRSMVRILPFEAPQEGQLSMPLDTGHDSLFIMATPPPLAMDGPRPVRSLDAPEVVDVHSHPDVDEYIILAGSSGDLVNGPTPQDITRTPFRGPCVIVMPSGGLHRIVMAEEHDTRMAPVLVYADRRAVVERYELIMARTTAASFPQSAGGGDRA